MKIFVWQWERHEPFWLTWLLSLSHGIVTLLTGVVVVASLGLITPQWEFQWAWQTCKWRHARRKRREEPKP